ncbi:MAG: transporter substrate-binding domain-containing protein [Victivallaceae bacterium]|nr:transporter substrate-binding domain-containing protein [Victivallaceae bacterium]
MYRLLAFAFAALLLVSCSKDAKPVARKWRDILASGKLVVLTLRGNADIEPYRTERLVIQKFAAQHNLSVEYVTVESARELFDDAAAHRADIVASGLSKCPELQTKYLTSIPYKTENSAIFTATGSDISGNGPQALYRHVGCAQRFSANLRGLKVMSRQDSRILSPTGLDVTAQELISRVASGEFEYGVVDESYLKNSANPDAVRVLFLYPAKLDHVLAVPFGGEEMLTLLNRAIGMMVSVDDMVSEVGDLDVIQSRGFIRMLTLNNPFCCYLRQGTTHGFEYELMQKFAAKFNIKVVTVIPPSSADLTEYLKDARGDIIAANFTITKARAAENPSLVFCSPYTGATEVFVGPRGCAARKIDDLVGHCVWVRRGSSYDETLRDLRDGGKDIIIRYVPDGMHTTRIIERVAAGEYEYTLADDIFVQLAINSGSRVDKLFPSGTVHPYGWMARKTDTKLIAAVNEFFTSETTKTLVDELRNKFLSTYAPSEIGNWTRVESEARISPYDDLFRKYAKEYGLEWYCVAAVAYKESKFNPDAIGSGDASGIMMVPPEIVAKYGFKNATSPEDSIKIGTMHLAKLYERFADVPILYDRACFTLASWNAGYGHLMDARLLAKKKGLNPNSWNDVKKTFPLLAESEYSKQATHGYCNAAEVIAYVHDVMEQLAAYNYIVDGSESVAK